MKTFRHDGVYLRRFWWWFPWHLTRWWVPQIWKGGDEWCNIPLCFTIPPFGCFLVFWRRMRTMPCDECWAEYNDETRADYLPGGRLEGGRWHDDRPAAWELADEAGR